MRTIADLLTNMSAVKIAYAAEQLVAKRFVLDAEPIAVVGLSCRFPGANGPDAYWQLLEEGRDAIREVPPDRWSIDTPQGIDSGTAPHKACRYGGFVNSIGDFDATHFAISPREAAGMDPQQRLLLEVTWEALENACLSPERLFGSRTGVYVGISTSDYRSIGAARRGHTLDRYSSSGATFSVAAGRLSYSLGLKGPALAVDTACSSSLVAIHLACQSLRCRECDVALAGGVNALLSPETSAEFSKLEVLAPDGRCKAFDASADGYVRGEGCGVVVLKRLTSALKAGDRIIAVIRGSAVNHDGRSSGLTVPNGPSQEQVIGTAVVQAGLKPADVHYLEAHGTGTSLGDPIEMAAAAAALAEGRTAELPLLVGSVKTNIGHLEAASGIAGLIKVVLAIQHGAIPRQLHLKTPNPHIAWDRLPVAIVTETTDWPAGRRIAGVSSFGMSGTNAHVILEEPPAPAEPLAIRQPERARHLLPLSATSDEALKELAGRYAQWLNVHPHARLSDVGFTAGIGRSHLRRRAAVAAESNQQARSSLEHLRQGDSAAGLFTGDARSTPKLAWLFSGQGSQYVGMGRDLYEQQPVFRQVLDGCADLLRDELAFPLLEVLFEKEELLADTRYAQPALFSLQMALARLWQSWGVEPDVVLGHSVGQYAAACVADVFRWEEGLRLIAQRAAAMGNLPSHGAMAAVFADVIEVEAAVRSHPRLAIAAYNGQQTVVSGPVDDLQHMMQQFSSQNVRMQRLNTSQAFHSPLIEPALARLEAVGARVAFKAAQRTLICNVTGRPLHRGQLLDAAYWRRHAREPVQFYASMQSLAEMEVEVLLELGPQPVLLPLAVESWPTASPRPTCVASLRRHGNGAQELTHAVAQLYVAGVPVDWAGWDAPWRRERLSLPTYPFQRQRYWLESSQGSAWSMARIVHPLLGVKQELASGEVLYCNRLSSEEQPWLQDHRVGQIVVVPGATYVAMGLLAGAGLAHLSDVVLHEPLSLPEGVSCEIQLRLSAPDASNQREFQLHGRVCDSTRPSPWVMHAGGKVNPAEPDSAVLSLAPIAEIQARLEPRATEELFDRFRSVGLEFGPSFRAVRALWVGRDEALGQLETPDSLRAHLTDDSIHPALLDACTQVAGAVPHDFLPPPAEQANSLFVPVQYERVTMRLPFPQMFFCLAICRGQSREDMRVFDLQILRQCGAVLGRIEGLVVRRTTPQALLHPEQDLSDWLYEIQWREKAHGGQALGAHSLPAPPQLKELVLQKDAANVPRAGMGQEAGLPRHALEQLSCQYIVQALEQLGWSLATGEWIDPDALAGHLGILPVHRRLLDRLLHILADGGMLATDGQRWRAMRQAEPVDPEQQREGLLDRYPSVQVELTLLGRCGQRLADVLTGRTDPLGLLFPQQGIGAEDLYRDSPGARLFNGLIAQLVQRAAAALPADRRLRVLEIGAGTGGTTGFVLPVLAPPRTEYVYTDLSAGFFSAAESRFAEYPFVRYQTLDVERDPSEQGFTPHQFDLVLAANVLHATRDLEQTLCHIRQLLAPGGLLVLLEGLRRLAWVDLTFGLLEGWWRFADFRKEYPLLAGRQWCQLLESQGFTQPTAIAPPEMDEQAVLVARGPAAIERRPGSAKGTWLILTDQQGLGDQLADRLRLEGQNCLLVERAQVAGSVEDGRYRVSLHDGESWRRLLQEALTERQALEGVVHLWSLDAATTESTTGETLSADVEVSCGSLLSLVQALVHHTQLPRAGVWLVTCGGQATAEEDCGSLAQSTLWGMGKVLALEHPELACRRVDLDPAAPEGCVDRLAEELLEPDQEDQIALRPSGRWVPRLLRSSAAADRLRWPDAGTHRLVPGSDRTLAGLHFETLDVAAPGPGQVQVRVHAAGLNFRDVLDALGMVPVQIGALGSELSGEVMAVGEGVKQFAVGDRVVGLASGTFANRLNIPACLLAQLPPAISFVQGATVPVAFVTAELALQQLQLRAGQRILIHAASGGVGLAAVQLAQAEGAEVFATASRPKQAYLRSIGVTHVFDSRSTGFADGILEATGGQGVDGVLNSLTGAGFIDATLSALAPGGRFVELGKRDVWPAQRMQAQRPDVDYHVLALETNETLEHTGRALGQLMERFASGQLQTLPSRVWPLCEAPAAFRWMQQARHIGKIVLRMPPLVEGRFHAEGTYLITGGLGGLGLEVARWMVQRGAMHLVLNGRRPPDKEAEIVLAQLREAGAEVRVVLGDVSQEDQARRIVGQIDASAAPLRGVIHAAGVLRDGALVNQDWQRFADVLAPKTLGAWHLHTLTADLDLDLFVLFSSAVVLFGNRGQANHAAANTFLDALAHHRRAAGLPAASIDWGAWSDVGAAARRDLAGQLSQGGFGWITPEQGVAALERALGEDRAQLGVVPVDWEVFRRQPAAEGAGRFLETFRAGRQPTSARAGTGGDLWNRLRQLPAEDHLPALTSFVQDEVARVLRLQSPPDVQTGFADLGMDSLMAVELRNRLQSQLGQRVKLSSTLAFDYPTTAALADHLLKMSQSDQQTSQFDPPGTENVEPQGRHSDRLDPIDSETELDTLLSEKVSQVLGAKHDRAE